MAFCVVIGLVRAVKLCTTQYRLPSTATQTSVLETSFWVECLLGIFSAQNLRNSFFVDATLANVLAIAFFFGLSLFVVLCLMNWWRGLTWPVTSQALLKIVKENSDMLACLDQTKQILDDSYYSPPEFNNKAKMHEQIMTLDRLRRQARDSNHLLEWTLQDMIEELAFVYQNSQDKSILPNPPLEKMLEGLKQHLRTEEEQSVLMQPIKQDILQKLVVVRCLLGTEYVDSTNREEWEDPEAEQLDNIATSGSIGLNASKSNVLGRLSRNQASTDVLRPALASSKTRSRLMKSGLLPRVDFEKDSQGNSASNSDRDEDENSEVYSDVESDNLSS